MNKRKLLSLPRLVTVEGVVAHAVACVLYTPTNFFTLNMYLFLDRRRCKKFKGPGQIRRMNKAFAFPSAGCKSLLCKSHSFRQSSLPEDFARINVYIYIISLYIYMCVRVTRNTSSVNANKNVCLVIFRL